MRDFINVDRYLNELTGDIYAQPPDEGHTDRARLIINKWIPNLDPCETVLDVGCGQGFTSFMFQHLGKTWEGVTLGQDYVRCVELGLNVKNADMTFLPHENDSFHLIFARHVLEHSPMPLLTLMEWHRVSSNWLCVVSPTPDYWGTIGKNHYSVVHAQTLKWLLQRAGWYVIWEDLDDTSEIRLMCQKIVRDVSKPLLVGSTT